MNSESRLKVLLSAFAFSPIRGSEAAVGWNIATRLAKYFDVTVLHGDLRGDRRGEAELATYLQSESLPSGLSVIYIPPSRLMALLEKLHTLPGFWMLYYIAYRLWQLKALATAQRLHQQLPFDVCHQLTYIGYREPGYLWQLGIPFVWGPISGSETIPFPFYRNFRGLEFFRPLSRDIGNAVQRALPGRSKMAAQVAAKTFAVSDSEKNLLAQWGVSAECLLETGTTQNPMARIRVRGDNPLRIVWSGLFTPRKALPLLLQALCAVQEDMWHLTVLGDGPTMRQWRALACQLKLPRVNIKWAGSLSRDEALEVMNSCDILAHTGLREGTPHVVLEALSLGLPVICHDTGGMSTAVTNKCGFKIPLVDPQTSSAGFREFINRFIHEKHLLENLSCGALERANELTWDKITSKFVDSYTLIMSK